MDIIDRKQWFKWQPREDFVLLFILGHTREAREFWSWAYLCAVGKGRRNGQND